MNIEDVKWVNPDQEQLDRWTNDGAEKLRYEYNLNSNSICMDLGAFYCEWSAKISDMYSKPTIYSFEPIPHIYDIAVNNIKNYENIKLFNYGAGKDNCEVDIVIGPALGVSSSLFLKEDLLNKVKVKIRSIKDIFEDLNNPEIDLLKINIEGSEYDVFECLIENNLHKKIKNIQVQFHRMPDDFYRRYLEIKNELGFTHKLTYDYPFIWENWELK